MCLRGCATFHSSHLLWVQMMMRTLPDVGTLGTGLSRGVIPPTPTQRHMVVVAFVWVLCRVESGVLMKCSCLGDLNIGSLGT